MTIREKACRYNYKKGIWNRTSCQLCLRMTKENCSLLREVNAMELKEDGVRSERDLHPVHPDNQGR